MKTKCPHCGTEYEVEKQNMYRYTKCEVCGKGFVVGADSSLLSSEPSAPNPPLPTSPKPSNTPQEPTPSTPPRQREMPAKRTHKSPAKDSDGGMRSPDNQSPDASVGAATLPPFVTEVECLKAWTRYWIERLLIGFVGSFFIGFTIGFVARSTGTMPFVGWPQENPLRLTHIGVYAVTAIGVWLIWTASWMSYKRNAVRKLFMGTPTCNTVWSWLVPMLVCVALSLLMPPNIQITVMGIYGYVVWTLIIWVAIDYCLFRFVSVRLLCGQKIDVKWLCHAILLCILIVMTYGVAQVLAAIKQIDKRAIWSAEIMIEVMKELDTSRHHDAGQIYDRMGRMKLY